MIPGRFLTLSTPTSSVLDQPLNKPRREVALHSGSFMFRQIVQYALSEVQESRKLEDRLHEMGLRVGYKVLDLLCYREKNNKRETRLLGMLSFITNNVWRYCFGRAAELLKSSETDCRQVAGRDTDLVKDTELVLCRYMHPPQDIRSQVSVAAYAAGIVEGVLCSGEFVGQGRV
ncbi:MAG: hypothetical protein KVP17_001076 [Porospora cf. gigantea B]|uniref:uncharacterized protein n=1 Tax=Porospora cf. gigantea B TaxID=2853592 RepID=UPI003571E9AC|nr:MAG: hypothetical protein KVP17_001076 [Porospora cf. gigantea B]